MLSESNEYTSLSEKIQNFKYCNSLVSYKRRETIEVHIGDVPLGGKNPIRVQSMTTVDTMDTQGSVEQAIRMIEMGCEYVRITAPSIKEAENLENIKKELRKRGYNTPLVADIHFTPNAAELAARIVEKVRVNPGNYADKKRFELIDYTEAGYQAELERIREKFIPLIKICKEYGTAMRIGTNHGSLSDRILSRYGDTPLGMVESALEFLRICQEFDYHQIVLSMKASNTQVMVQAYRLLVNKLEEGNFKPYPLHLGVTEAGDGEDGRIKSAIGIGTLLEDGLGDTVRVSLTEEPEFEMPVGRKLVARYIERPKKASPIEENKALLEHNPFIYQKRSSREVGNIGKDNVPRVLLDFSKAQNIEMKDFKSFGYTYLPLTDKWGSNDTAADYVYLGDSAIPFMMPNGLKALQNHQAWQLEKEKSYPCFANISEFASAKKEKQVSEELNFIFCNVGKIQVADLEILKNTNGIVLIAETENAHAMAALRAFFAKLKEEKIDHPVIIKRNYEAGTDLESLQLFASTDVGGLLIDGQGEGIMLSMNAYESDPLAFAEQIKNLNSLSFGILQAARTRMTKTEYISCPSCGRTLFDLQETTAMIRQRTDHLKGIKIGIMGCIVNGPGEMADADYGYVGSGKGKITLYRGQEVVKRSVPSQNAVDELIELIKEDDRWIEPQQHI